jgi:gliding motility-associated lipoprotein GldD
MKNKVFFIPLISLLVLYSSCSSDYSPKPRDYFHINLPETVYQPINGNLFAKDFPFAFEISNQAVVESVRDSTKTKWFNLDYSRYNAKIYCSYFSIDKETFPVKANESRRLAYFHEMKANGIEETAYSNPEQRIYGLVYKIVGNTASPVQFVITDSVRSFFRGALYFDNSPNVDSIAPVLAYINKDIQIIMESFRWKQ